MKEDRLNIGDYVEINTVPPQVATITAYNTNFFDNGKFFTRRYEVMYQLNDGTMNTVYWLRRESLTFKQKGENK